MSKLQSSSASNTLDPRLCTNPATLPFCSSQAKTATPNPTPSNKASSTPLSNLTSSIPTTTTSVKAPKTTSIKVPSTTSIKAPTTTSIKVPSTTSIKIPTTTQYITTSTTTTSTKISTVTSSQTTMILKDIKPTSSAPKVGAGSSTDALQADAVKPTAVKNQGQDDPAPTGNETTPSPIFSSITPQPSTTLSPSTVPSPPASSSVVAPVSSKPLPSAQLPEPSTDASSEPTQPPPTTSTSTLPSSSFSAIAETETQKAAPSANQDSSKTSSSADFEALAVGDNSTAAPTENSSKPVEPATSDAPEPSITSASSVSANAAENTDQPTEASGPLTEASSTLPASITPTLSEILNPAKSMVNSLGNNNPSTLLIASGTKPIPTKSASIGPAGEPIAPPGTAPGSAAGTQPTGGHETSNPDLKLQSADKPHSSPPTGVIVGTAFGGFAAIAVIAILIWLWRRKAQRRQQGNEPLTPLNGPAGGMIQGDGGAWGQSERSMEEVQPNPRRLTLMPPGSSSSNNPFSDANAVDKQPVRGILKAPVFEPFNFTIDPAAVGVAATSDVAVPPVPPRSRARTVGHRTSQSFSTPSRPQSSRHVSSLSLGQFGEKRDKFRSDPFDLELDTSMIPSSLTPQVSQNPRASSIYSSQTPNPGSRYTSGVTVSTLTDVGESPITGPTWDSPTLGNAELNKSGKKWPDNAFGVGQAL